MRLSSAILSSKKRSSLKGETSSGIITGKRVLVHPRSLTEDSGIKREPNGLDLEKSNSKMDQSTRVSLKTRFSTEREE